MTEFKFSDVIAFKNLLDNTTPVSLIKILANADLLKIIHLLGVQKFLPEEFKDNIQKEYQQLQLAFDSVSESVVQFREQLQKFISQREMHYYNTSSELYYKKINLYQESGFYTVPYTTPLGTLKILPESSWDHSYIAETVESILNQKSLVSEDFFNVIKDRMLTYADWHYTAAIIRPGHINFINLLVANDPLYLIDEHPDLLTSTMDQFNPQYQARLRPYVVNEIIKRPILNKFGVWSGQYLNWLQLPEGQFAFFLAFNYFNYRPFEIVKQYLEEIFQLLKPGGVVGMTFNDCDRYPAVGLVENNSACYTPGHIILDMAKNIGYKLIFQLGGEENTWVELQKPGTLTSIKGGQTLAKINFKQ